MPKMLIMQEVKTPSHVPKRTGAETKKFAFHQGRLPNDFQNKIKPRCQTKQKRVIFQSLESLIIQNFASIVNHKYKLKKLNGKYLI